MAQVPGSNRMIGTPTNGGRVLTQSEWEALQRQNQMFRSVIPDDHTETSLRGLILRPRGISFATQNKGEEVFMLLRQHWSTNIGWIMNTLFYCAVPFVIYVIANLLTVDLFKVLGFKLIMTIVLMYYSFMITNIVRNLSDWYFNLYIVTSERVLDYDYHPFRSSGASETSLTSIQDVKQSSVGFLPSVFNYGDVSVFSAADLNVITFHKVPDPTLVRDKILDLAAIAAKHKG